MFKSRIKAWRFQKYMTRDDWLALIHLDDDLRATGQSEFEFRVHGKRKTTADLDAFIGKEKSQTRAEIVAEARRVPIPSYVQHCTSDADRIVTPGHSSQDGVSPSLSAPQGDPQLTPQSSDSSYSPHTYLFQDGASSQPTDCISTTTMRERESPGLQRSATEERPPPTEDFVLVPPS